MTAVHSSSAQTAGRRGHTTPTTQLRRGSFVRARIRSYTYDKLSMHPFFHPRRIYCCCCCGGGCGCSSGETAAWLAAAGASSGGTENRCGRTGASSGGTGNRCGSCTARRGVNRPHANSCCY